MVWYQERNMFKSVTLGFQYKMRVYMLISPLTAFLLNKTQLLKSVTSWERNTSVEMVKGVTVVNSTAQKDNLIIEGNDIEAISGSAALIQQSTNKMMKKSLFGDFH
uniref:Uncharacterized protein n=1 Tax=Megaselia scalaris TaxID=36166 RepID=T1H2L5_MEGSC